MPRFESHEYLKSHDCNSRVLDEFNDDGSLDVNIQCELYL